MERGVVMKKTKYIFATLLGVTLVASPLFLSAPSFSDANAAADEALELGKAWFTGNNCYVKTYTDKALNADNYEGFTSEIYPEEDSSNVRVTVNSTCQGIGHFGDSTTVGSNNAELILAFEKYNDQCADLVMFTYTDIEDPNYKLSIIVHKHNNDYSGVTVAFTDRIVFKDGYAYLEGTNTPTVGYYNSSSPAGYRKEGRIIGNNRSPLTGTGDFRIMGLNDGFIQQDVWGTFYAKINDPDFLEASVQGLPDDSPYKSLYTEEYANTLISKLSKKYAPAGTDFGTSSLSITYIGVNYDILNDKPLAFRIRQYDGDWLGDGLSRPKQTPVFKLPFISPKLDKNLKQITLHKETIYAISDIIDYHNAVEVGGQINTYYDGWNTADDSEKDSEHYFTSKNMKYVSSDIPGEKLIGITIRAYCNQPPASWSNRYSPLVKLYFDVDDEHMHQGEIIPRIDPTETEDGIVEHFECQICHNNCDKDGNVLDSIIIPAYGNFGLPESLDVEAFIGGETYFPLPVMNGNYMYTIQLYNSKGEPIENGSGLSYLFTKNDNYKLKYKFEVTPTCSPEKIINYNVSLAFKTPDIFVLGEYNESYYLGENVDILDAYATNGLGDTFVITTKLFINGVDKGEVRKNIDIDEEGSYTIRYLAWNENYLEPVAHFDVYFKGIKDEELPTIILVKNYNEKYFVGDVVELIQANAYEAIGIIEDIAKDVYYNDNKIVVVNNKVTLDKAGTVKVVYKVSNHSGISNTKEVTFQVENSDTPVEKGNNLGLIIGLSVGGGVVLIGGAVTAFVLIKKKKKANVVKGGK